MERLLSSSRGPIKLHDVGVCEEIICDIAKGSVNRSSSAHCPIRSSGYTGHDIGNHHRDNSQNTLEEERKAVLEGNLDFIFLSLWVQST